MYEQDLIKNEKLRVNSNNYAKYERHGLTNLYDIPLNV